MIRSNILNNQTAAEQFILGVNRMKDPDIMPWPGQANLSMYDFFVLWHHRAMMLSTPPSQRDRNAAHTGPVFLPWPHYMLIMFEFFLRDTLGDQNFRLLYWDWAGDAELPQPFASPLWNDDILGQFTGPDWRVRLEPNPTGSNPQVTNRELRRSIGMSGRLPQRSEVRTLIRDTVVYDLAPYDRSVGGFRNLLEGWVGVGHHNIVHVWIGGDMTVSTSPNDPVFFLHHCNVDRIWAAWQQQHPTSPYLPQQDASDNLLFHRIDDAMHTFFEHGSDITPRMMLDTNTWYQYDTFVDLL
ncbi:MAG: tyrosinase [Chloroflexi bacterium AL-W]|nr:tyrosinase [Chloroflexi bacterium AL-N1]NOK68013.1 tyrosinase [Chloroflexi bacterium AL-N10]NOK73353.1 tyrosinase [Chloroflexi bacterium AL-N5]NOK83267.1 tyrosinase [Chloroflexi bacterium AL-W]NOK87684.1 tyrosinase [Chloroflexi bacterium AL-N15]